MSEKSARIIVTNISCTSCKKHIESKLCEVSGILKVTVNVTSNTASIQYDDKKVTLKHIKKVLNQIGYPAKEEGNVLPMFFLYMKVGICLILAAILFVVNVASMFNHNIMPGTYQLVLASIVQFYGGWSFYVQSYKSIKAKALGMDVLVTLGTSVAYLFSLVALIFGIKADLYFETSSVVIALVLTGRLLEARAKNQAKIGMTSLVKMQPQEARLIEDGIEKIIPIDEVKAGDIIAIYPGEKVPVDGKVTKGSTSCDESMISGESASVRKDMGDKVVSGSLNNEGSIFVECIGAREDTLLGRMIKLVEEAQNTKPKIQNLVDKISGIFIPIVLGIAIASLILSWIHFSFGVAMANFVATLVIACPCALGLATPTVIMVVFGVAAKKGILIKDFSALEQAGKVNTVVFDKTGTITEGRLEIVQSPEEQKVCELAQSLAKFSSHPLAKALGEGSFEIQDAKEEFGKGVSGKFDGASVYLGSKSFLEEKGVKVDQDIPDATVVLVGKEDRLVGAYAFKDKIREDAHFALHELKSMGINTILLSGDKEEVVSKVAKELAFSDYMAGVSPEGKAEFIEKLPKIRVMVGDGINDALALAKADVGIAMGSGTDVAMETASIGIMQEHVSGVVKLIRLGRSAKKRIVQNLFLAFAYNIVALPLAALGFVNPMVAAFAMSASSILVVCNALRKY